MSIKKVSTFLMTYLDVTYQAYLSRKHPQYFRKYQQKRLQRHLRRVVPQSTYYRSLVKSPATISHQEFPIMDKTVMMTQFDRLNTRGITLAEAKQVALKAEESRDFAPKIKDVSVGMSSGTTGNQGVFLVSDQETVQWSAAVVKKAIDRRKFGKAPIVIAFFMRASNNLYDSMNQGKINLHFFDLLTPVKENLKKLDDLQPNVIVAQPSMLRELAKHYQTVPLTYDLKEVFSIAEVLEKSDRHYIEGVLKCPLKEIYQATEGFLGISCQHGTLHLNEDIVYIEKDYIDHQSGRFVPIITDLYRSTQPLIRYRHTDILVEQVEPCPCGSSFIALKKIEGREDDCFIFDDRGQRVLVFPDFIRYAITRASAQILQFNCEQVSAQEIVVTIELASPTQAPLIVQQIEANLKDLLPETQRELIVITVACSEIPYVQGVKLRRVVSRLKGGPLSCELP